MARSRASDHDEKRDAILHRAAEVFARQGFDRASMAGLAAECGVSKALLYHYCASKEALLFAILRNHLGNLVDAVEDADDPSLEPETRLGALVAALLEAYRDADSEHRVQIGALHLLPQTQQAELKELERRLVRLFARALNALDPQAFRGNALLMPVTMSLFGMLNWFYLWHRDDGPVSRVDYARLATRLIAGGIGRL